MSLVRPLVALHVLILVCFGTATACADASARPEVQASAQKPSSNQPTPIKLEPASKADDKPYITKLPRSGPVRIVVFGDSLGRGLYGGLNWAFSKDANVKIINGTRPGTGLARNDLYNWPRRIKRALKRHKPHAVVVLIGGNDRQDMRMGRTRLQRFSKAWFLEYRRRVQQVMGILQHKQIPTYWVALPNVRSPRMSRDFRWFNDLFELETARHGFTFLKKLDRFSNDSKAKFRMRGLDIAGRKRQLRDRDGMHFTLHGYRLLAALVGQPIRKDIEAALRYRVSSRTQADARRLIAR